MGIITWATAISTAMPTPTGTVVLIALLLILGFQLLLQAAVLDINNVPTEPIQSWDDNDDGDEAYPSS